MRAILLVGALLIPACGEGPAAETTPTTTTPPTTTSTVGTTTTVPDLEPAPIDTVAMLPDEAGLQDGTWAVVVFQQALECIAPAADLAAAPPAECDAPVIFVGEGPDALVGKEVPVWLVRWPVLTYALADQSPTLESLRSLSTLLETTSDSYTEGPDGAIEISGRLPDGGVYAIEVAQTTTFEIPPETGGEEVALSDLTGRWENESHLLQVDEGGSYELFELGPDGSTSETGVFGFVALQGGLLIFPASANPGPCPGETGVYFGEMLGEELHLAAVDEPCTFRQESFEIPWSLSSNE